MMREAFVRVGLDESQCFSVSPGGVHPFVLTNRVCGLRVRVRSDKPRLPSFASDGFSKIETALGAVPAE